MPRSTNGRPRLRRRQREAYRAWRNDGPTYPVKVSRDPALSIACPYCGAQPGNPCIGDKAVHAARREASYKARYGGGGLEGETEQITAKREAKP